MARFRTIGEFGRCFGIKSDAIGCCMGASGLFGGECLVTGTQLGLSRLLRGLRTSGRRPDLKGTGWMLEEFGSWRIDDVGGGPSADIRRYGGRVAVVV